MPAYPTRIEGGGSYTQHWSTPSWAMGGSANPEHMIWYHVAVTSPRKPLQYVGPPEFLPDAHIRWGDKAQFGIGTWRESRRTLTGTGIDEDEELPPRERHMMSEFGRYFTDFRVEHPDDEDQYHISRVTDKKMSFDGPTVELYYETDRDTVVKIPTSGINFLFDWADQQHPGTEEEGGQEPESPPTLEARGDKEFQEE